MFVFHGSDLVKINVGIEVGAFALAKSRGRRVVSIFRGARHGVADAGGALRVKNVVEYLRVLRPPVPIGEKHHVDGRWIVDENRIVVDQRVLYRARESDSAVSII